MTKEVFNLGSAPNAGNGDPIRVAFQKIANNFDDLYLSANTVANTLTVIDGQIVLVNANAATLRTDLSALANTTTADIAALNANVSALANTVGINHQDALAYANTTTNAVQNNVSALAATVSQQANTTTAGLNDLLDRITAANSVVATLAANGTAVANRVAVVENDITLLRNAVTAIETHDDEIDLEIDGLLTRMGLAENAITDTQNTVVDLSDTVYDRLTSLGQQANATLVTVNDLSNTSSSHSNAISNLGSKIDLTNANVAALVSRADTTDSTVTTLSGQVTQFQQDMGDVIGQIGDVAQGTQNVRDFANTIETRVEVAENAITTLSSNVSTSLASVQANVAALSTNTTSGFFIANAKMDAINATITALSANSLEDIDAVNARLDNVAAHANSTNNPHAVTPAQIGAVPTTSVGASGGIAELDGLGKLKYSQRPAYGYGDFLTGEPQISLLPSSPTLALGSGAKPWSNVFSQAVVTSSVETDVLTAGSLTATIDQVVIASPLLLTNIGTDILTANDHAVLRYPVSNSVQISAPNNVILASGDELEANLDPARADAIVAAQDDVILYSNLAAGWAARKEIRFSTTGAIETSTFSLSPTAGGLEFISGDFTISSNEIILNTAKPLVVSGVEFSYDGNAVLHLGNFQPSSKVSVSDYTNAAVFAKILTQAGPGSLLDADLLDGQHGAFYRNFNNLTDRPTTLAGYGITDAVLSNAAIDAATLNGQSGAYYRDFGNLTNRPTTLFGYGIVDGQPLSEKLTSLSGLSSDGVLNLTANAVSTIAIGTETATSLIDRQSGDLRYVQANTANQPDGYLRLTDQGKIPASILAENSVISVAGLDGVISSTQLKTALGLSPADIAGLEAILDDKVSISESSWSPITATGTGSSQNITLPQADLDPQHVMVTITGIVQDPTEYSITGSTLSISAPTGAGIVVRRFGVGPAFSRTASIQFVIDGNGGVITSGTKGDLTIPFDCTIVGWTLLADTTGSIEAELWKSSFASAPPTSADKITGSNPVVLIDQSKAKSSSLTSWSPSVSADDVIRVNVVSAATVTRITLSLTVTL